MNDLFFSYKVIDTSAKVQVAAQIEIAKDEDFTHIIYDTKKDPSIVKNFFSCHLQLEPRTKYYWRVSVWNEKEERAVSQIDWFETGKMSEAWEASWITPDMDHSIHPVLYNDMFIEKGVEKARMYICGLGVYEAYINDKKIGEEFLAPGNNNYHNWIQYQTYDITTSVVTGKNNIEVMLGNGWYKGNFGFNGGMDNIFGDSFALIAEIHLLFKDGTNEVFSTDTRWKSKESKIRKSSIYFGEIYDDTFSPTEVYGVKPISLDKKLLEDRRSVPVVVKEKVKPLSVITTPKGELVIDMGQNMVGWLCFKNTLPKGKKISIQHGEILQEGNFYRENLRYADAEFHYISNSEEKWVRPHFTFYGFRYAKITGLDSIELEDFVGEVVYSDLEQIGKIETSNEKVNRLFQNALWGQKGNFLDIPTDCPQRDERMGWTGDAQVFSPTAAYNMNAYPFFGKFGYDLWLEQQGIQGAVPMTVPTIPNPTMPQVTKTSSVWGDAATIIPWNMYLFTGDATILKNQFDSMRAWVEYIQERTGDQYLWNKDFHFGDWLALDGEDPKMPTGGTDRYFVASSFYYYSTRIVSKAASVIGEDALATKYETLARQIKQAIQNEYFSPNGRLTIDKQTAYVLALYMELCKPEHTERLLKDLVERLKKDDSHLKTGFVGTPYICKVLSEYGYNDVAYTLLLNEDYPSWLYAVNLGATTIWERWDSVLPDGKINPAGMNSLNHYAYGSIVEWMYQYMVGLKPDETAPGFQHAIIAPKPNWRLKHVSGEYHSVVGRYEVKWSILDDGRLDFKFTIPFNGKATIILPNAIIDQIDVDEKAKYGDDVKLQVDSGIYHFCYQPKVSYIRNFSIHNTLKELLDTVPTKNIINDLLPQVSKIKSYKLPIYLDKTLIELKEELGLSKDDLHRVNNSLRDFNG